MQIWSVYAPSNVLQSLGCSHNLIKRKESHDSPHAPRPHLPVLPPVSACNLCCEFPPHLPSTTFKSGSSLEPKDKRVCNQSLGREKQTANKTATKKMLQKKRLFSHVFLCSLGIVGQICGLLSLVAVGMCRHSHGAPLSPVTNRPTKAHECWLPTSLISFCGPVMERG